MGAMDWVSAEIHGMIRGEPEDSMDKAQRDGEENNHEDGMYCMINEMQVLVENGWAHV